MSVGEELVSNLLGDLNFSGSGSHKPASHAPPGPQQQQRKPNYNSSFFQTASQVPISIPMASSNRIEKNTFSSP
jgi:hypothetical protein